MSRTIGIGIVQPRVIMGEKAQNLANHLDLMKNALNRKKKPGIDLLILPETPFLGWIASNAGQQSEPASGPGATIVNSLRKFAAEHQVMICSGFTEKLGGFCYNSAILIDKTGDVLYTHRKNNEVGKGTEIYTNGTQMCVISTSLGRIGIIICADNFVGWHHEILRKFRCELILTPGAWVDSQGTDEATLANIASWHEHLKRTSQAVGCPVVGANGFGTLEAGAFGEGRMWGHSIAYQDHATLAAEGETEKQQVIRFMLEVSEKDMVPVQTPDVFEGPVSVGEEGASIHTSPPPFYGDPMLLTFAEIGEQYEDHHVRIEVHRKTP